MRDEITRGEQTEQRVDPGSFRDRKLINELSSKYDLRNPDVALELYEKIAGDPYYFESETGQRFTRSLLRTAVHSENYLDNERTVSGRTKDTLDQGKEKTRSRNNESKKIIKEKRQSGNRKTKKPRATKKPRKKSFARKVAIAVLVISCMFLCYNLYQIISYEVLSYLSEKKIEQLISCILTPYESNVSEETRIEDMLANGYTLEEIYQSDNSMDTGQQQEDKVKYTEDGILYQYSALYERNQDMIGWIQIEDTIINYPVMQTVRDEEYYLKRDFDRNSDINGLPFMDARNDVTSTGENLIIYGHNMKNGSMFSSLLDYEDESFYEEHPQIIFNTIYEEGTYDILAVFQTRVAYEDEEFFRYYGMTQPETQKEFESYLWNIRQLSYYDTGVDAKFGDTLITLSTCDRRINNGRFVVVAVKKNNL